jgi:hypothetical protein
MMSHTIFIPAPKIQKIHTPPTGKQNPPAKTLKAFSYFSCLVPVFLLGKETKRFSYFQNFRCYICKKTPEVFPKTPYV